VFDELIAGVKFEYERACFGRSFLGVIVEILLAFLFK
jgi:hypothetical protein